MKRAALLAAVVAVVLPVSAMAQGLAPGLKSSGMLISDTLTLTGVTTTNTIVCNTDAATASTTVGCITIKPSATLAANDTVLIVTDAAGTSLARLDLEGDLFIKGSLSATGSNFDPLRLLNVSGNTIYIGTAAANISGTQPASTIRTLNALDANDIEWAVANSAGTNILSVDHEGDTLVGGRLVATVQTVTVADDGAGTAPATTVTPTSDVLKIAYNDATNASVGTLSETGASEGDRIVLVHTGSGGSVVFTEIAGQQEIGGTACTLNLSDMMEATYVNASWHVSLCKDN